MAITTSNSTSVNPEPLLIAHPEPVKGICFSTLPALTLAKREVQVKPYVVFVELFTI